MYSPFKFPFPEVTIQILREGEWGQSCHSAATLTTRMMYVHILKKHSGQTAAREITKIINWTSQVTCQTFLKIRPTDKIFFYFLTWWNVYQKWQVWKQKLNHPAFAKFSTALQWYIQKSLISFTFVESKTVFLSYLKIYSKFNFTARK